jgi:Tol biopolymer transport system component
VRTALATAIIGVVVSAGCGADRTSHSSSIAFVRALKTSVAVFRMNASGCCVEQLTHPPSQTVDTSPAWSPDGKNVAFVRGNNQEKRMHLYVVDADGDSTHLVADVPVGTGASWSPDGSRILFVARDGLRTVSPSGGKPTLLVRATAPGSARWSPDGRSIAFVQRKHGVFVFLADADGRNVRRLTEARFPIVEDFPAWSPDGKWLAYIDDKFEIRTPPTFRPRIKIVRADGTGARTLTTLSPRTGGALSWSTDGRKIAFWTVRGGTSGIYTVPVGGGTPHLLVKGLAGDPAFSPPG